MENIKRSHQGPPRRNQNDPIKIIPARIGYPGLKSIKIKTGITHKSIFIQMDHMNPGNFSNIITGARQEPKGFTEALIQALKNLGITANEKELKQNNTVK